MRIKWWTWIPVRWSQRSLMGYVIPNSTPSHDIYCTLTLIVPGDDSQTVMDQKVGRSSRKPLEQVELTEAFVCIRTFTRIIHSPQGKPINWHWIRSNLAERDWKQCTVPPLYSESRHWINPRHTGGIQRWLAAVAFLLSNCGSLWKSDLSLLRMQILAGWGAGLCFIMNRYARGAIIQW